MEIKVSYRIKKLIECAEKCDTVADIGCDHGYLPYFLLKNKVCNKAVLIDISTKSLNKAKKLFDKSGLINAEFRQGDGLNVLKNGEADLAVIAGIGGVETMEILRNGNKGIKRFLLQPMRNVFDLRKFLIANNYKIEKDFIIFDKKCFYDIIITSNGQDTLTEPELVFGRDNIKNKSDAFIKFLNYKKNQTERLLARLSNEKRKEELINYLSLIDRARNKENI